MCSRLHSGNDLLVRQYRPHVIGGVSLYVFFHITGAASLEAIRFLPILSGQLINISCASTMAVHVLLMTTAMVAAATNTCVRRICRQSRGGVVA